MGNIVTGSSASRLPTKGMLLKDLTEVIKRLRWPVTVINERINKILPISKWPDNCIFLIMNENLRNTTGHYVCYCLKKHVYYYFDSFGMTYDESLNELFAEKQVYINTRQVQPLDSIMCAHYCLYFLDHALQTSFNYNKFLSEAFVADRNQNDYLVYNYLQTKGIL